MSICPPFKKSPKPYYTDGRVTLYHGDCREILSQLGKFDAVITDPPYGTGKLAGGYGRRQLSGKNGHWHNNIKYDDSLEALETAWPFITEKIDAGWLCLFFGAKKRPEFLEITENLEWFGEIIWNKKAPGLGFHIRYMHENIAVFKKGDAPKPETPIHSILSSSVIANVHPHEKPIDVLGKLIEFTSTPNQIILDPFCGSGTTLFAAKFHGRRAVGIEIDETYCKETARRLEQDLLAI